MSDARSFLGGGGGQRLPSLAKTASSKNPCPPAADTPTTSTPTSSGAAPSTPDAGAPAPAPSDPTTSVADPGPRARRRAELLHRKFRIPPFLLPIYQAAGIQYNVPWQVLAAINEIETDYGRNLSVSSAGARGWMQFLPSSWKTYGVDANDDGRKDPYNPVDAIFAAARYLKAAGADKDIRKAIFAYNHADWYVDSVMLRAKLIGGLPGRPRRLAHRPDPGPLPGARPRALRDDVRRSRATGQQAPESSTRRHLRPQGRAGHRRPGRRGQEGRRVAKRGQVPGPPGRLRQPLHLRAPGLGPERLSGAQADEGLPQPTWPRSSSCRTTRRPPRRRSAGTPASKPTGQGAKAKAAKAAAPPPSAGNGDVRHGPPPRRGRRAHGLGREGAPVRAPGPQRRLKAGGKQQLFEAASSPASPPSGPTSPRSSA